MKHRVGRRNYNIFAFDLESHNDDESIELNETSMWLSCLIDENSKIDDESNYQYSIDQVINRLEELSKPHRKNKGTRVCSNVLIYIYNLSFEWSFLLPALLKRGFQWKSEKIKKDDEYAYNSISTKSVSSVWQVELKFGKRNGFIILRDLAKIYGGGLRSVAESFNLETQKGEIDYQLNRRHDYVVTKEEKEYCFKDTRIIVDILLKVIEDDDKYFFKAMSISGYAMLDLIKTGYPRTTRPYLKFREECPILPHEETVFLRKSVSGGLTYPAPRWQFKDITQTIAHTDAHSMHPSSAYLNLFPYGYGEYGIGKPKIYSNRINCCHVRISYNDVKLHSVIQLIGLNFVDDYEITLWDFEIALMHKCYVNLEVEYIDYYSYKSKPLKWRKFYKNHFEERVKAKVNNDLYNYYRHKLIINGSYGKLLERGHTENLENIIDQDGIINSLVHQKIKPKEIEQEEWEIKLENAHYTYLPIGSAIPAYSRVALISHALKLGWQNIIYVDTDSIFFIWNKETEKAYNKYFNLNNELGGWDIEEYINRGQFTAPKRYKKEVNGKTDIKAGGFNLLELKKKIAIKNNIDVKEMTIDELNKIEIPYDEVNIVSSNWKVQRAYRCKGGTLIKFADKEMKVQEKYIEIYKQNTLQ